MNTIILEDNILTESEIRYIKSLRDKFQSIESPNRNNYYHRERVLEYSKLNYFLEKTLNKFKELDKNDDVKLKLHAIWVNKIDSSKLQSEDYHVDAYEYTSITFLDDDFEGGNLEISKYGNKTVIEPKVGRTVFFRGIEFPHRVLPLKSGVRHTLVTFWKKEDKKQNSLF